MHLRGDRAADVAAESALARAGNLCASWQTVRELASCARAVCELVLRLRTLSARQVSAAGGAAAATQSNVGLRCLLSGGDTSSCARGRGAVRQ